VAEPTIVALGGGGFSMEPANPLLDDYILALTKKARPKVCFLPTASGDADGYVVRFYEAFARRAEPSHLALFKRTVADLRAFVLEKDAVYVGGGNTANMLAVWRAHELDAVLREAWEKGVVLAGLSAGALCWFEAGVTDSFGPLAPLRGGLGFLRGSMCPHYDGEVVRRPAYQRFVGEGLAEGFAADDGAALHFRGAELEAVVSSRPQARGYRVSWKCGAVTETPLGTRYLGDEARIRSA
jgi:peptidase E